MKIQEREKIRMYEIIRESFPDSISKDYSGCISDAVRKICKEVFDQ